MSSINIFQIIILVSTIFPSGVGITIAEIPIGSSKIALLLSYFLVFSLIFTRKQHVFLLETLDKKVFLFGLAITLCSLFAGINNKFSFGIGLSLASNSMSWFLSYFSIYFLSRTIPVNLFQIRKLEKFIVNILVICAIIGVFEYLLKINFYGKISSALGLKDIGGVTSVLMRGDQVRARSSFDQSIALGFAMIIGLLIIEKDSTSNKILVNIKKLIFLTAMTLSFSRSSIAVYVFYAFYKNYKSGNMPVKLLILAVFSVGLILLINRIDEIFYLDDSLDSGDGNLLVRYRDFELVGYCLEKFPLFGIGSGLLHNNKFFESMYPDAYWLYDGALDNMFLGILVEFGIIGFIVYLIFLGQILFCKKSAATVPLKNNLFGLFVVGMGASLSYDVFVFPGVGRLFLIAVGLSISEIASSKKEKNNA